MEVRGGLLIERHTHVGAFLHGKHRRCCKDAPSVQSVRCIMFSTREGFPLTGVDGGFSCGDVNLIGCSCTTRRKQGSVSRGRRAKSCVRCGPLRTPVVQSRTDVNVRPLRGAQVGKSGLDGVVRSDLFSQIASVPEPAVQPVASRERAGGRRQTIRTHRVNLDDRPKSVLGQFGDRREEVPSSTC